MRDLGLLFSDILVKLIDNQKLYIFFLVTKKID
jgi:hypothetical protein